MEQKGSAGDDSFQVELLHLLFANFMAHRVTVAALRTTLSRLCPNYVVQASLDNRRRYQAELVSVFDYVRIICFSHSLPCVVVLSFNSTPISPGSYRSPKYSKSSPKFPRQLHNLLPPCKPFFIKRPELSASQPDSIWQSGKVKQCQQICEFISG